MADRNDVPPTIELAILEQRIRDLATRWKEAAELTRSMNGKGFYLLNRCRRQLLDLLPEEARPPRRRSLFDDDAPAPETDEDLPF